MRSHVRISILALLACALSAVALPGVAQASFGVEGFVAANCKEAFEKCGEGAKEPTKAQAEEQGYTQAAGHPPWGVTDFKVNTKGAAPEGVVKHIRVDVAPGFSTNPEAVPKCTMEEFGTKEFAPGTGAYPPPACKPETIIGTNTVLVYVEKAGVDVPLEGTVYNLVQPEGRASEFGVALDLKNVGFAGLFAHTLIEGNVEWASDYHDYFEIDVSPALPLVESRLVFKGNIGTGGFLTNPSICEGPGRDTTSKVTLTSVEGATAERIFTTPVGVEGCGSVPFEPKFTLAPETAQSDLPDGIATELVLPHNPNPKELDNSELKTASITLPEGMTLNPSAAHGLKSCATFVTKGAHKVAPGEFECPEASKIGTLTLDVPGLPAGSLTGNVYLGGAEPITKPPYIVYLDAESKRYGVSVHIKGEVHPNEATGQLTTTFEENPEQPFSNLVLKFNGGALAPIANPLACGTISGASTFTGYTGAVAHSAFAFDGTGCATPVAFAPSQSTSNQVSAAGANTSFTFNLERPQGQQYLTKDTTVLPAGLVGLIPKVQQCSEAQALAEACPPGSAIGTVTAWAGAGPTPYEFKGTAYLTGPYRGAPFGMEFLVPAVAGPFSLGNVIARATINVDQTTARVIVSSEIPRIVRGVPVRLQKLSVAINRQGFLINPTSCGVLATESTLEGIFAATARLSTPFQVSSCSSLKFNPSFKATTSAKTSKVYGASIETTINEPPGGANIKSVVVTLPKQLPSRLTTLQKACPEATFAANPFHCPSGSFVGGVRANTPVLPSKMKGPAILVSHGGAAFPDLDLVLEANGVRIVLVGNTNIKRGITTTTFASTPDAPVSSITVNLPIGAHSALGAIGSLCARPLLMPTTITGQNGVVVKQSTRIRVKGCGVQIVGHKVVGNIAYITVKTFTAGRVSASGRGLATVYRHLRGAVGAATLKVPLRAGRPFTTRLRVGFLPRNRSFGASVAHLTLRFR
jgi:hypothetical protein